MNRKKGEMHMKRLLFIEPMSVSSRLRSVTKIVILLCTIVLAFASSSFAVDGVTLINQATAVKGLLGCSAGFPITICHSGSYRLSGNLVTPMTYVGGILITANNVTIDLNGFTVAGPEVCTPYTYPVQCTIPCCCGDGISGQVSNVTIKNGTVTGMTGNGIHLVNGGSGGNIVDSVYVSSNALNGIIIDGGL